MSTIMKSNNQYKSRKVGAQNAKPVVRNYIETKSSVTLESELKKRRDAIVRELKETGTVSNSTSANYLLLKRKSLYASFDK